MIPDEKDRYIRIREHAMMLINRGYVRYVSLDKLTEILEAKELQKEKQAQQNDQQKKQ